jgi:myo-inositol-1(or 4)-monophosphatase
VSAREPDGQELLELATEAARAAGELLRERFAAGREQDVAAKSTPTDLVSEADLASQRAIRELITARRPDDGLLGEEAGLDAAGSSGLRWIIDPLDGTINFLFRIPQWSVTIAVADEAGTLAGVIYDPNTGELFTAVRGERPKRNGAELAPAPRAVSLDQALVATGFAYDGDVRAAQAEVLGRLIGGVRDIRRFGSAALDLAWTAAGRYDAYFERSVKQWDIAAGVLLCEAAGLEVHELRKRDVLPWGVLAAPPALAGELLEIVG